MRLARAALLALLLPAQALAVVTPTPPAGTFVMPAALAGVHPRLHFTAADIPQIRADALGPNLWFLDSAKSAYRGYKSQPVTVTGLDDWKNYLFGFWGQFSMDMFWIVEQDPAWASTAKSWALYYAGRTDWLADDLVPMDILSGMALTYDILHDQLTPAERTTLRGAIKSALDFILPRFYVDQYWTGDFQNNHMHNRVHGLAHAAFAIYGDDPAIDVQAHADLAVACVHAWDSWFAADGSDHEGPSYWDYSHHWLVGTELLVRHMTADGSPLPAHLRNDALWRMYLTTPGWHGTFAIGDGGPDAPYNFEAVLPGMAATRDGHVASALQLLQAREAGGFYQQPAWGLLWNDATVAPAPIEELPPSRLWPDSEMLSIRSGWDDDATAFVFRCGPLGGHTMQDLRGNGGTDWVNVAHDHSDQNHFLLWAHGKMLAEDDGYPKVHKWTRNHNTITVDGAGQPRDGDAWSQPFDDALSGSFDDVFLTGTTSYAAGNASKLYSASVQKFVRHAFFVEGGYVILIDDLVGGGTTPHSFDWRLHKAGTWSQPGPAEWLVADGTVSLDIQFVAPAASTLTGAFLPVEPTEPEAKPCLSVTTSAAQTKLVSVLVPQLNGAPGLAASAIAAATGGTAARVEAGDRVDEVGVPSGAGPMTFDRVTATAASAMLRTRAGSPDVALFARGSAMTLDGKTLLSANPAANLSWRVRPDGAAVDAEAPYRVTGGSTQVQVGWLAASRDYGVWVDGAFQRPVTTDGNGVASVTLDLSARRALVLTDVGISSDGGLPAGPDAGPDDASTVRRDAAAQPQGADAAAVQADAGEVVTPGADAGGSTVGSSCGCSGGSAAIPLALLAVGPWMLLARKRR